MNTVAQKWPITILVALGMADPQIPIPIPIPYPGMAPPPPPQQVPVPIGIPIPVAVAVPATEKTTSTTTNKCSPPKEEDSDSSDVKIVIPWPPFNWGREAPKVLPFTNNNFTLKLPPQLPLPPPGIPIPIGVPPPPVVMVPVPPMFRRPHDSSRHNRQNHDASRKSSSDTSGSTSQSSGSQSDTDTDSSGGKRKKKKKKKKKYGIYRSGRRLLSKNIVNQINPVLSFVSKTGEVKMQKRLSSRDAFLLLDTARDTVQRTMQGQPGKVTVDQNRAFVLTYNAPKTENTENVENKELMANVLRSGRKTVVINSPYQNVEKERTILKNGINRGRKTLVLHPPNDKTVSNISVIFNVAP